MFESDDYDQALSQLDFPDDLSTTKSTESLVVPCITGDKEKTVPQEIQTVQNITNEEYLDKLNLKIEKKEHIAEPNPKKRIILNSHFDQKAKRKFPGPAGLLSGYKENTNMTPIPHIEILSQDVEYLPGHLQSDLLETSIWNKVLEDTRSVKAISTVESIKRKAPDSKLQSKKVNIVRGMVEAIDRFATDPLLTLRDPTGHINATLHRDVWKAFSPYIVSQYCAMVLYKPTVLTTGNSFKKHYLNITLKNISNIYSSAVIMDPDDMPEGFNKLTHEDFTNVANRMVEIDTVIPSDDSQENMDLLDDLDDAFTEEVFLE